ncbi:hypothetical protein I310_04469 [Cryptococcus deuterogattii CA1014]|nr:hypothetical protein I310_04469 [Cryptococcus deuterogattii CA1014]
MPSCEDYPQSSSVPSQPAKRTRTRTGCYTCRRRKKLCDEHRPTCGACNRLGVPCVFPQLFLNSAGKLVASPQPNGKTKKDILSNWGPTGNDSGDTEISSLSTSDPNNILAGPFNNDLFAVFDELQTNNITQTEQAMFESFLLPMIEDTRTAATSIDEASAAAFLDLTQGINVEGQSCMSSELAALGAQSEIETLGNSIEGVRDIGNPSNLPPFLRPPNLPDIQPILTPESQNSRIEDLSRHLPVLLQHFASTFSRVVSVLGPDDDTLVTQLLPLAARSPLILHALVGWTASHLSILGEPYVTLADSAVALVEDHVKNMETAENMTDERQEENLMSLLILGGICVCRGDVQDWIKRLPETRQILRAASANRDVGTSQTWRSIALNLVYHDVLSSLAIVGDLSLPFDFYQQILIASNHSPDIWMGASMQVFGILGETAVLASQVSGLLSLDPTVERDRQLDTLLSKFHSVLARVRRLDLPISSFQPHQYHLITAFETYKLATELYLRQSVLHAGTADLCVQGLSRRILQNLRSILDTPSKSQMLFPLFVAGVNTFKHAARQQVVDAFNVLNNDMKSGNIQAVYSLLSEVWKRDKDGDRFVDWRKIAADVSDVLILTQADIFSPKLSYPLPSHLELKT